jgi:hypothetical protein
MPLLIESGCCNYDDPALVSWYRTTRAHNSVLIDGVTEAATSSQVLWVPRRETPNMITDWNPAAEFPSLTMVSPPEEATNVNVRWSRKITLVREHIAVISDSFEAVGDHSYEILLHFPPSDVNVLPSGKGIMVKQPVGSDTPVAPAVIHSVTLDDTGSFTLSSGLVSIRAASTAAPVASYSLRAAGYTYSHLLVIASNGENGTPVFRSSTRKGVTTVTVRERGRAGTRIKIEGNSVSIT